MKELNERMSKTLVNYFRFAEEIYLYSVTVNLKLHDNYVSEEMSNHLTVQDGTCTNVQFAFSKTSEEFMVKNSKPKLSNSKREDSLKICSLISDSYNSNFSNSIVLISNEQKSQANYFEPNNSQVVPVTKQLIGKKQAGSSMEILKGSKFDISQAKKMNLPKKSKEKSPQKELNKVNETLDNTLINSINKLINKKRCSTKDPLKSKSVVKEPDLSKSRYDTLFYTPNCLVSNPISNPNELAVSPQQEYECLNILNCNTLSQENNSLIANTASGNLYSQYQYIPMDQISESYYKIIKDELKDIKSYAL